MKKTTIAAVTAGCAGVILLAAIWIAVSARRPAPVVSSSSALSISTNSTANSESSQEILTNSSSVPSVLSSQESPGSSSQKEEDEGYILKSYNGRIGIFRTGENTPIEELDVDLENLPEADQKLLSEGIPAKDKETLRAIMEDYES